MERVKGIEPSPPAWKAGVLPLNNTRIAYHHFDDLYILSHRRRFVKTFFQSFSVWRKSLLFLPVLGGNRLSTSMCNSILTLFCGEKLKDVLCLAGFWLFWAEKDNSLPCATLFSRLFGIEKVAKDFRRSNAAAKARLPLHTSNYRR